MQISDEVFGMIAPGQPQWEPSEQIQSLKVLREVHFRGLN
jgi:hypothetical protein